MKQFVFNSSYNSTQKIVISSTTNSRLFIVPTSLSTSYSQRETLFNSVDKIGQPPLISYTFKVASTAFEDKKVAFTAILNNLSKNIFSSSQIVQAKSIPARRKRLRAFARAHFTVKSDILNSSSSFFILHQPAFFNKSNNKLSAFSQTSKSRFIKKSHVPLLLNSGQADGVVKTQRFGSS